MIGGYRVTLAAPTLLLAAASGAFAAPLPSGAEFQRCHSAVAAVEYAPRGQTEASAQGRLDTAQMIERVLRYMPHPDAEATRGVYATLLGSDAIAAINGAGTATD